jgi:PhoPQ-activated pathogenicity-related protein
MVRWLLALLVGFVSASSLRADEPVAVIEVPSPALADYVAKADDSFGWTKRREGKIGGAEFVELTLTSQTWRGITWRHQLYIIKPASAANAHQALLFIGGGRWKDELAEPAKPDDGLPREATLFALAAEQLKSPVAILLHVPQQPIFGGMVEDEIISHTFVEYYKTRDPEWPLLLPMVKSAVRAMDAVQQYAKQAWSLDIEQFTVAGASKRGWTTWLTSATDPRVTALAPMVIDMLNMEPQMEHQRFTFGGFSEQIQDYTSKGLQDMKGPKAQALRAIVDPYSYRAKLTQPKLIMLGTNDRYWPLDALNLYWNDLEGDKYIMYVPNKGHDLSDMPRVIGGLTALHRMNSGGPALPKLDWQIETTDKGLTLDLGSDQTPAEVQVWKATAPTRDFREAKWEATPVEAKDGRYHYEMPTPATGYAAMFGEARFPGESLPFYLSTNLKIVGGDSSPAATTGAQ